MASTASTSSITTATTATRFPKKIFLAISPSTTENQLSHLARSHGPVRNVHIPRDRETQCSRGFAFVTFRWHEHARAFLEAVEGSALDGLILHPRWASSPSPATKKTAEKTKRNGSQKRRDRRSSQAAKTAA